METLINFILDLLGMLLQFILVVVVTLILGFIGNIIILLFLEFFLRIFM